MFKLFKKLIKTDSPAPFVISFADIPSWLDEREQVASEILQKTTVSSMGAIREAVGNLEQVVQELRAAQFMEEIHPKLKSIAKNALPQYAKAMEIALSKPLPGEVEAFYTTSAEILKGCLNSTRGQGKYLQTIFPDDMRLVRTGIDAIGREINVMTQALALYRREMAHITEARKLHGALADIGKDTEKTREKERRIDQRIQDNRNRIETCVQELSGLERDDAWHTLNNQRCSLQSLAEERERTVHRYTALSMTVSHVLRKAEKIAHKKHTSPDERILRHATALLSDCTVPNPVDLIQALAAGLPIAKRMIDTGDIHIKNKEEHELFAEPDRFINEITSTCTAFSDQTRQYDAADLAFRSHPVVTRREELIRIKTQLEMMCAREEQSRADLIKSRDEVHLNIPSLKERLEKTVGGISGNNVQIQYSQVFVTPQGG